MRITAKPAKTPRPLKSARRRLTAKIGKPRLKRKRPQAARRSVNAKYKKKRPWASKKALLTKRKKRRLRRRLSPVRRLLRKRRRRPAARRFLSRLRRRHVPAPVVQPPQAPPPEPPAPPAPSYMASPPGLNLIGYIRTEIGLGEACRLMAKAFEAVELPFGIINFADPGARTARNEDTTWIHKERDDAPYRVNFFHMNANNLRAAYDHPFHPLGQGVFHDRFNIGYWAWELPDFPDEWCNSFELVNEVWAPSQFIVDAVQKKSPHPVIRIPHAVQVKNANAYDRAAFGLPSNQFLFLSMYDTHSLKERKNPQAAIHAFKRAFPPSDQSVGLVIKVNNPNSKPEDLEAFKKLSEGYSNIYFLHEIMSRDRVDMLINSTDCFVSLHRSEGFGLVLSEAMYLGKPVIGTNWSGNTDFMNADNSCPVNYSLIPVGQDIGPYKAHQIWADPDIEHAADYMRRLVQDSDYRQRIAHNGKHTIHTEYSPLVVGQQVKHRLTQLGLL